MRGQPRQRRDRQQDLRRRDRQLHRGDDADERPQSDLLESIARRHARGHEKRGHGLKPSARQLLGGFNHHGRRNHRQAAKVAGDAVALVAGPAGQRPRVDADRADRRIAPGQRSFRQRRTEQRDDRRARGRGDVQRPAVAADVERRPIDERAELREIEFSGAHDLRRRAAGDRSGVVRHAFRSGALRWARCDDDAARRISGRQCGGRLRERSRRPSPKRIAGADVHHDERRRSIDAGGEQPCVDTPHRLGIERHRHRVARAIGRADAERFEQRPLVEHRMARRHERSGPRHARRIAPSPPGKVIADALRRARRPRQQPAARPAVEIDHEIETLGVQPRREAQRRSATAPVRAAARATMIVSMPGMMTHHGLSRCFNEVGDARVGKPAPQRADRRRGEDHVADQPQPDQQDLHSSSLAIFRSSLRRSASPGCRP